MKKLLAVFVLTTVYFSGFSQLYDSGQSPASENWLQINTANFQLIFPVSFEPQSQKLANMLEHAYTYASESLNHKPKKISVVVRNQTSNSNGMVVWAPKRMELYTIPPQDVMPVGWLEQLTLHETRHVVQIDKLNQGITKIFSYLLGEQAVGGVTGMVPRWFLEGDAVATETFYTNSGRGRIPEFEMKLKANMLDSTLALKYDQAIMGSYKTYVPDQYQLGYQLVKHGVKHYGYTSWENTLNYVGRKPFTLFPFYFGLKNETSLSREQLYQNTFDSLRIAWQAEVNEKAFVAEPIEVVPKKHAKQKAYISYSHPIYTDDGSIIALKSSLDEIDRVVQIFPNGKEIILFKPGFHNIEQLAYAKGQLFWTEWAPDIRWGQRSYSIVKSYNIHSKIIRQVTRKSRLFAADIHKDGLILAAVEVEPDGQYYLTLVNSADGFILEKNPTPGNMFVQTPRWNKSGTELVMTFQDDHKKGIIVFDYETKSWNEIIRFESGNISHPFFNDGQILFTGDFNGTENFYSLDKTTLKLAQITDVPYGARWVSLNTNTNNIVFSNYTSHGYKLATSTINNSKKINANSIENRLNNELTEIIGRTNNVFESKWLSNEYEVKPYNKYLNSFGFHSWAPMYFDYDAALDAEIKAYPGLTILSQDKLSTAFLTAGYAYKENTNYIYADFTYKGWYPVFKLKIEQGGEPLVYQGFGDWKPQLQQDAYVFNGSVQVPLRIIRSKWISGIIPTIEYHYDNYYYHYTDSNAYTRGLERMVYKLQFYNYQKYSHRDFKPQWGMFANFRYLNTPFENENFGSIRSFYGTLYTPGIARQHSLKFSLGLERQKLVKYFFNGYSPLPRGYHNEAFETATNFSVDYALPLWYPDLSIGKLAYIKRFRANAFFDYGKLYRERLNQNTNNYYDYYRYMSSLGLDLEADLHLFRTFFPITSGIRMIYTGDQNFVVEGIFSVDIQSLY